MSSLKYLFTAAMFLACSVFFMGTSTANADWTSPVAVYDSSPVQRDLSFIYDDDQGTYGRLYDEDETGDTVNTNYIIFDLGKLYEVNGFRFMPRIHDTASTGPKEVSIFYFNDMSSMPTGGPEGGYNPNLTTTVQADSNVLYAASNLMLPAIHGDGDHYDASFTTINARYVGVLSHDSWDGYGDNCWNTFAEVYFDGVDVTSPGDANYDGKVNGADAAILASNWLKPNEANKAFVHQTIASGVSVGETYSVSFDATSWIKPSSMTADLYYDDNGTWKAVSSPNVYAFEGSEELDTYTFDWTAEAGGDYIGKDLAIGFQILGVDGHAARVIDNVSVTKDSVELVTNGDFAGPTLDPWNAYVSNDHVQAFRDTWGLPSDPTLTMRIVGDAPDDFWSWGDGDFNGDGRIDDIDATILAANWTESTASGSVPEPGCAVLFFSLIAALLCSCRLGSRK